MMENKNMEDSKLDTVEHSVVLLNRTTDVHGDIRINAMGQIEEYSEGYWQVVDWKYSSK
jgi:hypothetical protein